MEMPLLNFRIPPELLAAAEREAKAAGVSVGQWVRALIAEKTDVRLPEIKHGLAQSTDATKQLVSQLGHNAKRKRRRASK